MIHVVVPVQLKPNCKDAFVAEFKKILGAVRAENGCIEYGAAAEIQTDIGPQAPVREDVVTIIEKWESLGALKAHLAAPHMATYREAVKELVANLELRIYEPQ
jgi:quinol monooxygenase YgiN